MFQYIRHDHNQYNLSLSYYNITVPSMYFIDFGYIFSVLQLYYSILLFDKAKPIRCTVADTELNPYTGNESILNTDFICSINGSIDIHLCL